MNSIYTSTRKHKGFTLIELMIVIAIISLLSVFAFARLENALNIVNDSAAKSNLSIIRVAIMHYYAENTSWPQAPLENSICPDFINKIPRLDLNDHPISNSVINSTITDSGGWSYFEETGQIYINCSHQSQDGNLYSDW